ncbi:MAG: UbiA family prenyltransferase [Thermodesulfovibrionia bacterium]|nr:UbiA family prenyltransferase [Thermodesulfovibrionia bacterium]
MGRSVFFAAFQLVRPEISGLVAVVIFIPTLCATGDWSLGLRYALTIVPICMCGFVINAVNDLEKDRQNHPERPLPSGTISPSAAVFLFFVLIAVALTMIKSLIAPQDAFVYLLSLIIMINYDYVVSYFPSAKNFYVATAAAMPIVILSRTAFSLLSHTNVLIAAILYALCMEMLSDIKDMPGDGLTLAKRIGSRRAGQLALGVLTAAAISLFFGSSDWVGRLIAGGFMVLDLGCILLWHRTENPMLVFRMATVQPILGIYYLL